MWLSVSEAGWVCFQGLGNMAVSNAFGSNTFNIFVALVRLLLILKRILDRLLTPKSLSIGIAQAVPWLVGSLLADDGTYAVPKGRIFGSCLALGCVLIFFLGCVGARNSSRLCCFSRLCDFASLLGLIAGSFCARSLTRGWLTWQGRTSCG